MRIFFLGRKLRNVYPLLIRPAQNLVRVTDSSEDDLKAARLDSLHLVCTMLSPQSHRQSHTLPSFSQPIYSDSSPKPGDCVWLGKNCIQLAWRSGCILKWKSNGPPCPLLLGMNIWNQEATAGLMTITVVQLIGYVLQYTLIWEVEFKPHPKVKVIN